MPWPPRRRRRRRFVFGATALQKTLSINTLQAEAKSLSHVDSKPPHRMAAHFGPYDGDPGGQYTDATGASLLSLVIGPSAAAASGKQQLLAPDLTTRSAGGHSSTVSGRRYRAVTIDLSSEVYSQDVFIYFACSPPDFP